MLKHYDLAQQLGAFTKTILDNFAQEREQAYDLWFKLKNDELFARTLLDTPTTLPLPRWEGSFGASYFVDSQRVNYRVLAVDGSQLYPDRHQGLPLYVINIGSVDFRYKESPEMINCQRSELELQHGLYLSKQGADQPSLFLCDGSLLAWHLSDKASESKKQLFQRYISLFEQFCQDRILIAGYISLPKSRDLVSLVRAANALTSNKESSFDYLVDTDLLLQHLPLYHRTTIFESNVALAENYPAALRPHFFYFNVGAEIARIEIPAWLAADEQKVAVVEQIILDQVHKGQGYPICLAEAHEQAVIKAADRDIFYTTLRNMMQKLGVPYPVSQKSIKKRGIGI
jgi:hypothetical protein